jgi:predicted GNAT family N-acyltransferase
MVYISSPTSPEEFREYYDLRWRVLRAPWDQPPGSEQDEWEPLASHITARDQTGQLIGVGRLHINDTDQVWIRYMAVEPESRGQGTGKAVYNALEQIAVAAGATHINLNARESAVPFYQQLGFRIITDGPTMFGEIRHKLMQKKL